MIESPKIGLNQLVWNFRLTPQSNISLKNSKPGRYSESNNGPLALPGRYSITMHKVVNGKPILMEDKTPFECDWLNELTIPTENKDSLLAFQIKVDKLRKAIDASSEVIKNRKKTINYIKSAFKTYPNLNISYFDTINNLEYLINNLEIKLSGDRSLSKRDIEQKESISSKVGIIIWNMWRSRSNPTETNKLLYKTASIDFKSLIDDIKLLGNNIKTIESYLEENKVPYTPGRGLILDWEKE
tara:strand:- start:217 stop:942 length:726 start_codon:yes stop_codon:yes gene_type:complete